MTAIELNDMKQTFVRDYPKIDIARIVSTAALSWRAKSIFLNTDFPPKKIQLPMTYYEGTNLGGAGNPLAFFKAQLSQAGVQNLTFDNATQAQVIHLGNSQPKVKAPAAPLWWDFDADFLAPNPWWYDITPTTNPNALAVAGSSGAGTVNNFNITYAGSVFAEPLWTLTIPAGNTTNITTVKLQNTTTGEILTWTGTILANQAHTLTFNSDTMQLLVDATPQDWVGTFPTIVGPSTQVNTYALTIISVAATTGLTFSSLFSNRWEM